MEVFIKIDVKDNCLGHDGNVEQALSFGFMPKRKLQRDGFLDES